MSRIWIARRPSRQGLMLPLGGTREMPQIVIPLYKELERAELDELIRGVLVKHGLTSEAQIDELIEKAELQYEYRRKLEEVRAELKRLMGEREKGNKLFSVGFRKWQPASYRPVGGR